MRMNCVNENASEFLSFARWYLTTHKMLVKTRQLRFPVKNVEIVCRTFIVCPSYRWSHRTKDMPSLATSSVWTSGQSHRLTRAYVLERCRAIARLYKWALSSWKRSRGRTPPCITWSDRPAKEQMKLVSNGYSGPGFRKDVAVEAWGMQRPRHASSSTGTCYLVVM